MLYDQKINAVSILRLYLFNQCPNNDAAKLQPNTVESAQDHIETLNTATEVYICSYLEALLRTCAPLKSC